MNDICPHCKRQMPQQEGNRRLIVMLDENYDEKWHLLASIKQRLVERQRILELAFGRRFPDASKFRWVEQFFPDMLEWKFWIVEISDKYIQWAKAARECGLIDGYFVDYDPSGVQHGNDAN